MVDPQTNVLIPRLEGSFDVEVVYALPKKQVLYSISAQVTDTLATIIERSGFLQEFPEINLEQIQVGIFGKRSELATFVRPGDRIEIYRPLTIDPKEMRRLRALANKKRQNIRETRT